MDRCLCGNPLSVEQDGEEDDSIYCSVACARQDALDSLSARDPRYSSSSASSSCPSLATNDESSAVDADEGVWEWVTTPLLLPNRFKSHYQRVESLREQATELDDTPASDSDSDSAPYTTHNRDPPSPHRIKRVPVPLIEDSDDDDDCDRSHILRSPFRDPTPVPHVHKHPRNNAYISNLVSSSPENGSYSDHLDILDAYAFDAEDEASEDDDEPSHGHPARNYSRSVYNQRPNTPVSSVPTTPLQSFRNLPTTPPHPSRIQKRAPTPIDIHAANEPQSPSMRRLVEALDRLHFTSPSSSHSSDPFLSPNGSKAETPSTASSTSSLQGGPITPLDLSGPPTSSETYVYRPFGLDPRRKHYEDVDVVDSDYDEEDDGDRQDERVWALVQRLRSVPALHH